MSNPIERPIFFEGQILGAVDLQAALEYHRGADARHNRYLHIWGIVNGLDADVKDSPEVPGAKDIKIKPGMAIDDTGREIVLADVFKLNESAFKDSGMVVNDPAALYPVFLTGRDAPAPQQPLGIGACSTSQPTRKIEAAEVKIGRPLDVLDSQPKSPDITAGPGSDRLVLLGFVKWDASISKFSAWEDKNDSLGVARRYAGVRADVVEARGSSLSLRTSNSDGQIAVLIDKENKDDKMFQFGTLTDGTMKPVFSISSSGDVIAEGTISGAVTAGSVQIQSGIATDGVILPLPSGITEEQVADAKVTLHIYVSPRFPGSTPPSNVSTWVGTPLECSVDPATRRVLCRTRWFDPGVAASIQDVPAACNYLVIASVPAPSGG